MITSLTFIVSMSGLLDTTEISSLPVMMCTSNYFMCSRAIGSPLWHWSGPKQAVLNCSLSLVWCRTRNLLGVVCMVRISTANKYTANATTILDYLFESVTNSLAVSVNCRLWNNYSSLYSGFAGSQWSVSNSIMHHSCIYEWIYLQLWMGKPVRWYTSLYSVQLVICKWNISLLLWYCYTTSSLEPFHHKCDQWQRSTVWFDHFL